MEISTLSGYPRASRFVDGLSRGNEGVEAMGLSAIRLDKVKSSLGNGLLSVRAY